MIESGFAINSSYNHYILIPILILFVLIMNGNSFFTNIYLIISFILSLFILILPLSRQNIATFLIVALLLLIRKVNFFKLLILLLAVFLVFLYFYNIDESFIFNFTNSFAGRFEKTITLLENSNSERVKQFYEALRIGIEYPFGIGLGNFHSFQQGLVHTSTESGILQIFAELGFLFFIIFISFLFKLLIDIKSLKKVNYNMYLLLSSYFFGMLFLMNFNEILTNYLFWAFVLFVYLLKTNKICFKEY
ncbi:O-antigen ligase family protein [Arcobacter roscoffensis]|uniref:O-antigen ligase family protein n=1 Tax=Arcobacter roscoffensis TaxID=2961520 RepID=A0ABY5E652_9BACT|nr:O-antigen ligase family protein [Arcobacter roscoffensis]UTJ07342.1 O-antigen ligase family protein [Arcobacter roscoffensis]